jgi:capsular exopolysaccharide synthesis family protein
MRRAAEERAAKSRGATADLVADLDVFPEEPGAVAEPATEAPVAPPPVVPAPALSVAISADVPPAEAVADTIPESLPIPDLPLVHTGAPSAIDAPAPQPHVNGKAPQGEGINTTLLHHLDTRLATKTVVDDTMPPASREQYRRLAAALHQAQRMNGTKVVMIASAAAGEGKTLTASNLAMTLSESYRRNVLLIDGDLRRPSLHSVFQIEGVPGLSEGLISVEEEALPLHKISPRLAVLPAGRPTQDPIGALVADRMRRLIDEAREVFDWVVIDTPPVGLLTDAALLASMADCVVMVIKAGSTSYDLVNRAVEALGRERIIGCVLNRATDLEHRANYDYYRYYYGGTKSPAVRG